MADPKEGGSFLSKVARFVANPATDWNEINHPRPADDGREAERSEIKAMVERKRRNDFVRKREFDTLRRLRRDGLSPEQLAALGGASRVDDSEARPSESSVRPDAGVKAKIDEIEQQMVGDGGAAATPAARRPDAPRRDRQAPRPDSHYDAPTEPLGLTPAVGDRSPGSASVSGFGRRASEHARLPLLDDMPPPRGVTYGLDSDAAQRSTARPSLPQLKAASGTASYGPVQSAEMVQDEELDEAVIAFANADFASCEQALEQMRRDGGRRHEHADTWLALFDLYRATGQQVKFEALALEFADLFGRSAPQWFSLPKLVAEAAVDERPATQSVKGEVGWVSPPRLDGDALSKLRSATLQLPLPWVLDWSAISHVEPQAAAQLVDLFRQWAPQRLDMRWLGFDRLLQVLYEAAPTGARDADPAYWMARLLILRLSNRPDQFDETAIDYCVTYEVSPPSWESAECQLRSLTAGMATAPPTLGIVGESSSGFVESRMDDGHAMLPITTVELSGQLAGDISAVLKKIDGRLGGASLVQVSCARLIRVDFIAAGDLLNWVLAKLAENRSVTFADAHRLVALFFGAMGINEHARVQVSRL